MNFEKLEKNVIEEKDIINNIKGLAIDMIDNAGSGHPGIVLGAAPILYTLFTRHLNVSTSDPLWVNRDRFVMSAGHGSALLYATLFMSGFSLTIDDLKHFRRVGYHTPGHPEVSVTPGVDVSTGPLGQGIATAVGLALASKMLAEKYQIAPDRKLHPDTKVFDHNVYVLVGDGDLMEGISYEAASFAGANQLNNLIVLYDSNQVSLDGSTSHTFTENVRARFEALGFHTAFVKDGENIGDIDAAIKEAKKSAKPSFIEIRTVIGNGSKWAGTAAVHGKPLERDDIAQLKEKLGLSPTPFEYSEFLKQEMIRRVNAHTSARYDEWAREYDKLKLMGTDVDFILHQTKPIDLIHYQFSYPKDYKEELRKTNGEIMNTIADMVPNFVGGSADLFSSTGVYLRDKGDISSNHYLASNIWYGVREHAMGAIMNGLALSNFKTYGSTFLAFADYLKPAMRMSALMNLDTTYIFTHDSVSVGADGPTHEPIEQLASIRAIPNMYLFRPADVNEIIGSWHYILNENHHPNTLVISKDSLPILDTKPENVLRGGYIIAKEPGQLHGILIATGSEVHTALLLAKNLYENEGLSLRVVSMPSRELFLDQEEEYQVSVLPKGIRTIVIEAGSSMGWHQFVYHPKYLITIDSFGVSGTREEVLRHVHFHYDAIEKRIIDLLK